MRAEMARRGFSAVEMIVALVIVAVVTACLLLAVPNSRERARRAGCQANLMQIGLALSVYHQAAGHWPSVALDSASPIKAMLEALGQPDFAAFRDPKKAPPRRVAGAATEHLIPGLLCPSDRQAWPSPFPAPVSYRANTGASAGGQGGPFAIGRTVSLNDVEAADGAAYTAAFSERLIGDGSNAQGPGAYVLVQGSVDDTEGCPYRGVLSWRGDAGSSWLRSDWRSTLYSHIALPGVDTCIAEDGRTAFLGPSSRHVAGVHVLFLDGSTRMYSVRVAYHVWIALGTVGEPRP